MELSAVPREREAKSCARSPSFWLMVACVLLAVGPFPQSGPARAYEGGAPRRDAPSADAAGKERIITVDDLSALFREELLRRAPWPSEDVQITRLEASPARVRVPDGDLSFDVTPPPNARYLGRVSFLVTIKVDGEVRHRVRVGAWVEVYRPVFCATRSLGRGHVLRPDDLAVVRSALSRMRGVGTHSPEAVVGQALRHSVAPGQVLTDNMLTAPVLMRRGARVTILAESSLLTVSVPGEACENGVDGGSVRVRNLMSEREIVAQVVDSKTVLVHF